MQRTPSIPSVRDSANNTIGGAASSLRNVISGNEGWGIELDSTSSLNGVYGNYIGISLDGTAAWATPAAACPSSSTAAMTR